MYKIYNKNSIKIFSILLQNSKITFLIMYIFVYLLCIMSDNIVLCQPEVVKNSEIETIIKIHRYGFIPNEETYPFNGGDSLVTEITRTGCRGNKAYAMSKVVVKGVNFLAEKNISDNTSIIKIDINHELLINSLAQRVSRELLRDRPEICSQEVWNSFLTTKLDTNSVGNVKNYLLTDTESDVYKQFIKILKNLKKS